MTVKYKEEIVHGLALCCERVCNMRIQRGTLRGAELLRAEDAETRTVVCEMTEGGAPAGVFYRLNDHFGWGFQS